MKPISFYLITDTHYFEPSLGAEGKAYEEYMKGEQFFLKESSAIVKSTFERISEDKETDLVIIPGDLSKNGEKESHKSFVKELNKLKENEKKNGQTDIKMMSEFRLKEQQTKSFMKCITTLVMLRRFPQINRLFLMSPRFLKK